MTAQPGDIPYEPLRIVTRTLSDGSRVFDVAVKIDHRSFVRFFALTKDHARSLSRSLDRCCVGWQLCHKPLGEDIPTLEEIDP